MEAHMKRFLMNQKVSANEKNIDQHMEAIMKRIMIKIEVDQ